MKKIRYGIIGCGRMMKKHIKGIRYVENAEVTAFCDIIRENAEYLAEDYPGSYVTTDWTDMVDYVDAVLVALPHHLHYQCGVFFARNKKHVLMEKPLCNTEEECLRLIEICKEENVKLMCAYPVRHWPGIKKLKELVDSGEYGKVIQMSVWTEQLTRIEDETHWGNTAQLGGGQFFSHGCHYVDLLFWFLGNPVAGTHFGTKIGGNKILGESTSIANFKFENGALGYHGATWNAVGTRLAWDCQMMMEKGLLDYDRYRGVIKLYNKNKVHDAGAAEDQSYVVLWEHDTSTIAEQTQHEIRHFTDCIINDKTPITDGETALKSLQAIWRMYDAEKHGVIADLRGLGFEE